ncbi:MAG: oxidoreductase [Myxococcaceae bacterium]|jgi:NAD(P)-dependent dehydrogenase (short-subunit alcohol dehydrogenase family)|nr:oxidoreductase [Myxococcaceae bacterium]
MAETLSKVSKVVLITGCSSGIGRATALRLASNGHRVVATARKASDLAELEAAGCDVLALDVTDEASMVAAVRTVEAKYGAVGVLVNNAGYSQSGAIEAVPLDRVRRQFETNVFGLVRLTQLVLPGMRRQGFGRVINLSSMGGKLTFPGGGYYHATKHAVEAISDALRFEVQGFGIKVVLIEPGLIRTGFSEAAVGSMGANTTDDVYGEFHEAVAKATKESYETGPLARMAGTPDDVAAAIERAITATTPRARYTVSASATVLLTQRKLLSDRVWDWFLGTNFPVPGAAEKRRAART